MDNKINYKKLYEKYKETMRAASKRYKTEHKKQISEYNREYFQQNKEKIYAKRKQTKDSK